MPAGNRDIAAMLRRMADVRRLEGANAFQVGAYTKAARAIEQHPTPVVEMSEEGLRSIRGIGASIAAKIAELCVEGSVEEIDRAEKVLPMVAVDDLTSVPGIGPVRARKFIDQGIITREQLRAAIVEGTVRTADPTRMLAAIDFAQRENERFPLYQVVGAMAPVLAHLAPHAGALEMAGSVRRRRETVKDVDLVAWSADPGRLMATFCGIGETIAAGDAKASIFIASSGIKFRCDLLVVDGGTFGAALNHFTGSKEHNVALRTRARAMGLTVSEFGVFRGDERIGGRLETDLYDLLGVPYHPPELREGEPWAMVPSDLITSSTITSDLHTHTVHSDGVHTVIQMAQEAARLGLRTMGISDHIARSAIGCRIHGEPSVLATRLAEIRAAEAATGVRILSGAEVDIASDGSLELPAGIPDGTLDYVMASIHHRPDRDLGPRTMAAILSGRVHIIGHCTGRAFGRRPSAEGVDWEGIFRAAARAGVGFELNGQGDRLDPPPELVRLGLGLGVRFMPCSDAHSVEQMGPCLQQAVSLGRRAGLTTDQLWHPPATAS